VIDDDDDDPSSVALADLPIGSVVLVVAAAALAAVDSGRILVRGRGAPSIEVLVLRGTLEAVLRR